MSLSWMTPVPGSKIRRVRPRVPGPMSCVLAGMSAMVIRLIPSLELEDSRDVICRSAKRTAAVCMLSQADIEARIAPSTSLPELTFAVPWAVLSLTWKSSGNRLAGTVNRTPAAP